MESRKEHNIRKVQLKGIEYILSKELLKKINIKRAALKRNDENKLPDHKVKKGSSAEEKSSTKIKILHVESTLQQIFYLLQPHLKIDDKSSIKSHYCIELMPKVFDDDHSASEMVYEAQALAEEFNFFVTLPENKKIEIDVMVYTSYDSHFEAYGLGQNEIDILNNQVYLFWQKWMKLYFQQHGIKSFNSTEFCMKAERTKQIEIYEYLCNKYYQENNEFKSCIDKIETSNKSFKNRNKAVYNTEFKKELATKGLLHEVAMLALVVEAGEYTAISHKGKDMIDIVKCVDIFLRLTHPRRLAIPLNFFDVDIHVIPSKKNIKALPMPRDTHTSSASSTTAVIMDNLQSSSHHSDVFIPKTLIDEPDSASKNESDLDSAIHLPTGSSASLGSPHSLSNSLSDIRYSQYNPG